MTDEKPQMEHPHEQLPEDAVSRVDADVVVPANAAVAANVLSGASAKVEPVLRLDQKH